MSDPRVTELLLWSELTGIKLPMKAEEIVELESEGHTVDLVSGDVLFEGANVRVMVDEKTFFKDGVTITECGNLYISCSCDNGCGSYMCLTQDGVLSIEDGDGMQASIALHEWMDMAIRIAALRM